MQLLNDKEKRVFGSLNKLGEVPVSTVAEETLINRTALYHTIESLVKRGLVTRINKEGVAYFRSISLVEFEEWTRRQVITLEQEANELHEWLVSCQDGKPTLYSDIRYYEGVEGVKSLYSDTWRDNDEKIIYALTDYERAYKSPLGQFFLDEYFPDRISHGVSIKNLLPPSVAGKRDFGHAKEMLRDMRFINLFKELGIEINIYGSKISLVVFEEKKPLGVIIKNEVLAKAFKKIFEYLWSTAK
ncbi:MAG: hypothetical protein KBD47_03635 [Candidatus Pacebacteria bacterium]|nr:hypothetical protein [Candidatus Paceibacterota bacterium]